MSGVAVIRHLLANAAPVIAVIPAVRISAGDMPINTPLPAIGIKEVSAMTRLTVAMTEAPRIRTERVQVTVAFKLSSATPPGPGYPAVKSMLKLVPAACPNQNGTVNGVAVDSILPDVEGPDLQDDETGIVSQSRDFIVKYRL